MPTLADIMSFIDARKRVAGSKLGDIMNNPQLAAEQFFGTLADGSRAMSRSADKAMSVMPEVRDEGNAESIEQMLNLGGMGGLTAFHGTPYKFDKFDMSKIGTGEGAQVYGHGLYFAEHPEVARQYQKGLSQIKAATDPEFKALSEKRFQYGVRSAHDSMDDLIAAIQGGGTGGLTPRQAAAFKARNDQYNKMWEERSRGNLLHVDIPDEHVANMLQWDKTLGSQPKSVQDSVARLAADPSSALAREMQRTGLSMDDMMHASGQWVVDMAGGGKAASDALRSVGIPGIKYLDQGSRAGPRTPIAGGWHDKKKKQTHNFVLFDDEIPKIIGRE